MFLGCWVFFFFGEFHKKKKVLFVALNVRNITKKACPYMDMKPIDVDVGISLSPYMKIFSHVHALTT